MDVKNPSYRKLDATSSLEAIDVAVGNSGRTRDPWRESIKKTPINKLDDAALLQLVVRQEHLPVTATEAVTRLEKTPLLGATQAGELLKAVVDVPVAIWLLLPGLRARILRVAQNILVDTKADSHAPLRHALRQFVDAMATTRAARIVVKAPAGLHATVDLAPESELTIGSSPSATLMIPAHVVELARTHIIVRSNKNAVTLRTATTDVRLNGAQVLEERSLADGDVISVGVLELSVGL